MMMMMREMQKSLMVLLEQSIFIISNSRNVRLFPVLDFDSYQV